MSNIKEILEQKGLRVTSCRLDIVNMFKNSNCAISHSDIENKLKETYDRVTMYRTLNTFLEKGIIHKVLDDSQVAKYALCTHQHHNHNHEHTDDHIHFQCTECEETVCIENISVPKIEVPKGFIKKEVSYLVKGICDNCSSS